MITQTIEPERLQAQALNKFFMGSSNTGRGPVSGGRRHAPADSAIRFPSTENTL
jgi:hypothetical protein